MVKEWICFVRGRDDDIYSSFILQDMLVDSKSTLFKEVFCNYVILVQDTNAWHACIRSRKSVVLGFIHKRRALYIIIQATNKLLTWKIQSNEMTNVLFKDGLCMYPRSSICSWPKRPLFSLSRGFDAFLIVNYNVILYNSVVTCGYIVSQDPRS